MENTIQMPQAGLPATITPPVVMPVLNFQSAAQLESDARKVADDAKAAELATLQANSLLSYMQRCFNEASIARQLNGITDQLLEAQRRRLGQHSEAKIAQLRKYNLPNYWVPVTQTKCIHTEAWLRDIMMPYGEKTWKSSPTEIPDLQEHESQQILSTLIEEAQQFILGGGMVSDQQIHDVKEKIEDTYKKAKYEEAKEKAENMESLIQDQHEECNFRGVFKEFQANLTTYGTAFLKGPFTVVKKFPKWNGEKRVVEDKIIPSCSAPSPHDIYPAPWAKDEQDGYIIERIKTYREGLSTVRKLPYYQQAQIEQLLQETATSGSATIQYGDWQRNVQENKAPTPVDNRLEIFQFNGPIPGYMLQDWGMKDCDAALDYNVEVLWSRNYILKVMPMWDEAGVRPYFRGVFKAVPGSFWGIGVPMLMSASQDRANSAMIQLLDNSLWGSGFIGWIDQTRLVNVDDVKEMHSKKWIASSSGPGQNGPPLGIVQVELHIAELNAIYEKALTDADNESGVPAYMYGSGSGGPAAGTYSGLTTLMNASARGIKDALLSIDEVIAKFIQHWADWCLEYVDDESIKGDIRIVCSGATGLFVQEMVLDKIDNLLAQSAPYISITGPGFVLSMLKQKAHILKVDASQLPTDEEIKSLKESAGAPPPPQQIKPSLSISAKIEQLTPQERQVVMGEIGVSPEGSMNPPPPEEGQASAPTGEGSPGAVVPTTGTPSNVQEVVENNPSPRVKPIAPVQGQ